LDHADYFILAATRKLPMNPLAKSGRAVKTQPGGGLGRNLVQKIVVATDYFKQKNSSPRTIRLNKLSHGYAEVAEMPSSYHGVPMPGLPKNLPGARPKPKPPKDHPRLLSSPGFT